jgi:hypothetical protein
MEVGTFSFGKYRGWPACDVPIDYLVWAVETMARPPAEVVAELKRRAARLGSRDAITAQTILGGMTYRKAKKERRRARKKNHSPSRRTGSAEIVGAEFHASRAMLQGDAEECPF